LSNEKLCKICGHPKSDHNVHIGPDHTGKKTKHITCYFHVTKTVMIDGGPFGDIATNHCCSCDGFKPNTSTKRAIKKYQKYLKTLPKTSDNLFKRKEILSKIRSFRKSIKENPKNLLHWQMDDFKERFAKN